jgi:glycosyltransferase involved in cell wall biosynthesis
MPGRVFRNEAISARAHCLFHQVEGLYVDKDVSFKDLKDTLYHFAKEMFGKDTKVRFRPSYFPFTEPSAEMDITCLLCKGDGCNVCKQAGWVEIAGAGMVDPNVLENVGIPGLISKKSMLRSLRYLERKEFPLRITSETENYRLSLAKYLTNSGICEYPIVPKTIKIKSSKKIVIGFLGSARADKGFEEIQKIIPIVKSTNLVKDVNFFVQESTISWGIRYDETLNLLRQFSSTRILPGYISDQEMNEVLSSCTMLLLPYNSQTYAYRGSAMLFEAADSNIPIIAPAGTGMGTTIRRFGIGATYSNIAEIPVAIKYVSSLSQEEISMRFKIYNNFRNSTLRKFFE